MRNPRKYMSSKWFQLMLERAHDMALSGGLCPFCISSEVEWKAIGDPKICHRCRKCPLEIGNIMLDCITIGKKLYKEIFG